MLAMLAGFEHDSEELFWPNIATTEKRRDSIAASVHILRMAASKI
jgi:hypothetical protein